MLEKLFQLNALSFSKINLEVSYSARTRSAVAVTKLAEAEDFNQEQALKARNRKTAAVPVPNRG